MDSLLTSIALSVAGVVLVNLYFTMMSILARRKKDYNKTNVESNITVFGRSDEVSVKHPAPTRDFEPKRKTFYYYFIKWIIQPDKPIFNDFIQIIMSIFIVMLWWFYYLYLLVPTSAEHTLPPPLGNIMNQMISYTTIFVHIVATIGLFLGVARLIYKTRR